MKIQKQSERKQRTRTLIQVGGLIQKCGLMEAFSIHPGDDLQDYENLQKASQLLGFLRQSFERNTFDETLLKRWQIHGERLLKNETNLRNRRL